VPITALGNVADYFEQKVDEAAVEALSRLMDPIIVVMLGTRVGRLVIAMYLSVFKLGAVV
jgi:type IV pilus assembly protein PilC